MQRQPIKIPVNDLGRYMLRMQEPLLKCAREVIAGAHYVLGAKVREFESLFANYCGVAHCIGVANGTEALELALRGIDLGKDDYVVVAANAAMYGTTAVLAVGAKPVFADVDPDTALLGLSGISRAVANSPARPKAVIVTHLYGRAAPMAEIMEYAQQAGVKVIEDCAQAHGARLTDGRRVGSVGDIGTFSFYPTKNLGAIGDGGALTCNDDKLSQRIRQLRQYGWSAKYDNALAGGRNSRLDELQAAFLCVLIDDLDTRNARRRAIANRYSREISNPGIRLPREGGEEYVAHLYVIQCRDREQLQDHLAAHGIGSDVHYPIPDYRQAMHGGDYSTVCLPATELLSESVLTLPCFPELDDDEIDAVIAACNNWRDISKAVS